MRNKSTSSWTSVERHKPFYSHEDQSLFVFHTVRDFLASLLFQNLSEYRIQKSVETLGNYFINGWGVIYISKEHFACVRVIPWRRRVTDSLPAEGFPLLWEGMQGREVNCRGLWCQGTEFTSSCFIGCGFGKLPEASESISFLCNM